MSSDEEEWKGYLYLSLLVGINMLNSILNSLYFKDQELLGLQMRSALTSALFRKRLLHTTFLLWKALPKSGYRMVAAGSGTLTVNRVRKSTETILPQSFYTYPTFQKKTKEKN
jgi:hypothetical protein